MTLDSKNDEIQELRRQAEALICCLARFEPLVHDDDIEELGGEFYNRFHFFFNYFL